jgi:hypothetical protein
MPFTFKLSQRLARMRSMRFRIPTIALVVGAVAVACEIPMRSSDTGEIPTRVAISPKIVALQQNQSVDFTAIGFTAAGDTAVMVVSWSATSGAITDTSTNNGRHRGRYRAGADTGHVRVVVKGNPGGYADTGIVTVTQAPVATLVMNPTAASIAVGRTLQLAATTQDSGGNPLSGRTVTWASTNPGVASVNGGGLVSGLATGVATVEMTRNSAQAAEQATVMTRTAAYAAARVDTAFDLVAALPRGKAVMVPMAQKGDLLVPAGCSTLSGDAQAECMDVAYELPSPPSVVVETRDGTT